jgi:hypothetical protein
VVRVTVSAIALDYFACARNDNKTKGFGVGTHMAGQTLFRRIVVMCMVHNLCSGGLYHAVVVRERSRYFEKKQWFCV